jgi:hypothetical protein
MARSLAPILGAALLLAAGCGSSASTPSPTATIQSPTSEPSSSRNFQVTTPDGQVSVSLDGQLPPNWPSGFPVPAGAQVAGSGSLGGASSTEHVAVYSTTQSPSDTFSFYSSNTRLTTTSAKSAGTGSSFVGSVQVTAPYTGSVTVVSHSGTTYIVIVLRVPGASPSA